MTTREELIAEVRAIRDTEGIVSVLQRALMRSRVGLECEIGKLNQEASK
jgi:hypothetical protein